MNKTPSNNNFYPKIWEPDLVPSQERFLSYVSVLPLSFQNIFLSLSVSLLLGVSTFQNLKIIRISRFIVQTEHFHSWNDQMLFILLLLTLFMAITAITLILFPRRPKRLKPHTYDIVNYIYCFTLFTKYLIDQIEQKLTIKQLMKILKQKNKTPKKSENMFFLSRKMEENLLACTFCFQPTPS